MTPTAACAGLLCAVLCALGPAAPAALAGAKAPAKPAIQSLSSDPDLVTGGDALIAVGVPKGAKPSAVRVRRNGVDVTSAFEPESGGPRRLVGLVAGLRGGANRISARAKGGAPSSLSLFNSPAAGPLISGPHQTPFICRTEDAGLGPAADANCFAPTKVEYRYLSTDTGAFKPLADPSARPSDLAQTTTRDGETVDFVVRIESGVINRSIYRWSILSPGGRLGDGWNERLIYSFGGGCGAGYQQGSSGLGTVLDKRQLSRGYSVMSGSLTVLGTACNDVLSAETVAMVKEHVIESLGEPPVWTIGEGGSGGSIQAQMIAQNYPGLLDGLLPTASFPDNTAPDYPDCRLLQAYYATPDGGALSTAQRESVSGLLGANGCGPLGFGADVVNATEGCDESVLGGLIYDPGTNPGGARCTVWDSMVNVYGRDPATGFARRTLDNVGVQYGLEALAEGDLTIEEFLDLNEGIGGYDDDGFLRAERSVADPQALATAFRTGRVNFGAGGIPSVPIVDARNYQDDEPGGNVHQYVNTFRFRERLQRTSGTFANHVMFRAEGGSSVNAMNDAAIDLIGEWLDRIEADDSDRTAAQKVIAAKPSGAADACWIGGNRINEPATVEGSGQCATAYPPHSLPVNRAGKPLDSFVIKCSLRPIDPGDYPSISQPQLDRLEAIFPGGVCDYSQAGVGERSLGGTWQEFGPERTVTPRRRSLKLSARVRGRGSKRAAALTARLAPCPEVIWQGVVFERRGRRGWSKVASATAEGGCRATARVRLKRRARYRVRAAAVAGYAAATSKARGL